MKRSRFDFIRYANVWEDADILCEALRPRATQGRILSIASSGDNIDYGISQADIEEWEALHGQIPPGSIVLFHTGWDRYWDSERFCKPDASNQCHFPGIAEDGALLLWWSGLPARSGSTPWGSMWASTPASSRTTSSSEPASPSSKT